MTPEAFGADASSIYVVLWNDRHSDVEPFLFTDLDLAIQWVKERHARWVNIYGADRIGPLEVDNPPPRGWAWAARYGEENRIWIVAAEGILPTPLPPRVR